jgi:CBS domain-containing protein
LDAGNAGDVALSIESILRQKGTDVVTIDPEATIKSAAGWLRAKNIGALVVTSAGRLFLGSFPNDVRSLMLFLAMAKLPR